jgi:DNA-binding CsgD family transcriptional regulator
VVFFASYILFECATWIYFSDVAQRYRISPFIVFGFGRGALAAGTLLSVFIASPFGLDILDQRAVIVLMLAALLVAYVLIPQNSTLRKLIITDGNDRALDLLTGGDAKDAKGARIGWFKHKCNVLATRYLLSQRETEVLFLLAKGHNAAYIQEQLYIAEGTCRTHMRHIYKKLDIHAQQELIKMVESLQVDPPDDDR